MPSVLRSRSSLEIGKSAFCRFSTLPVQAFMAAGAQGNQVQIVIRALLAAQLLVVDLQVLSGTTDLASPAIAAQHLFSEPVVWFAIEPQTRYRRWREILRTKLNRRSCPSQAARPTPGSRTHNRSHRSVKRALPG